MPSHPGGNVSHLAGLDSYAPRIGFHAECGSRRLSPTSRTCRPPSNRKIAAASPSSPPWSPRDEAGLIRILTEPRNTLVRQYQKRCACAGVALEFAGDALKATARKGMERETGARGLRSIPENLLRRPMFDLPVEIDVIGCTVDEAAISGAEDLKLIRKDEEGLRAASGW